MIGIGGTISEPRYCNHEPTARMNEKSGLENAAVTTVDLRGLKCPLPVLRTRKILSGLPSGAVLIVSCTDPLAGIDIPHLVNQTGDMLEATGTKDAIITFRIRKR